MAPFPHQDIDPAALDICNISLEHMMEYQSPKKGFKQLYKLLNHFDEKYHPGKKFTVIGYNVAFDVDFVSRFFRNNGSEQFSILQNYKYVDVLALVRLMIDWGDKGLRKLGNNRLATLCDFFDIPLKAHDALEDIRATRTLYKALQKRMIKMMRG